MVSYVTKWNSVCAIIIIFMFISRPTLALAATILSKFPYILLNYALNINKISTVNSRSPSSCQIAILSNSLFDCHSTDQNYKIMDNNGFLTVNAYTD